MFHDYHLFKDHQSQLVTNAYTIPNSGLYVSPYATAAGAGADTLKDEPAVTIVPVAEEQ